MDPYRESIAPAPTRFFVDHEQKVFIDLHEIAEISNMSDDSWEIWYRNRPKVSIFYDELGREIFHALLKYRSIEIPAESETSDPDNDV